MSGAVAPARDTMRDRLLAVPWFLFVMVGVALIGIGAASGETLDERGSTLLFGVIALASAIPAWKRQRRQQDSFRRRAIVCVPTRLVR